MGVNWVRWVVGESVLPKCLTLSQLCPMCRESLKFQKIKKVKKIHVFTVFSHSNPNAINVPRLCVKWVGFYISI